MALVLLLLLSLLFIPIQPSILDPKQLTALQSMGIPTSVDPCSLRRNSPTICDSSTPFRHLVSLSFANCSSDLDISSTALRALSTLKSLSFSNCPNVPQIKYPPPLLLSFSCAHSFKHLSGVWLSHLRNLTDLTLISVPVSASAPIVFLSQMPHLTSATVTDANLSGQIPHHWHSLNLTHLDLSSNNLKGIVPSSINVLGSLKSLNFSSNSLSGAIPDSIGDLIYLQHISLSHNSISGSIPETMSALPELTHLDLGSNRLNGSVPRFLAEMRGLTYLNLEDNNLQGVIPFNGSFIKSLEVFRIGRNSNLCYNKSLVLAKTRMGIAACDRYGMPVSPAPDKSGKSSSSSGDYDDGDDDDDDGDEESGKSGGGGHHGHSTLVLGVAIGLSCLVFLVIFIVCLSKICG